MKRKKPIARKTPLKRSPLKRKPVPINKKSEKLRAAELIYSQDRLIYLQAHSVCEAKLPGCTWKATCIHHKERRGIKLLKKDSWLAVCVSCHNKIEINQLESYDNGLSIKSNNNNYLSDLHDFKLNGYKR